MIASVSSWAGGVPAHNGTVLVAPARARGGAKSKEEPSTWSRKRSRGAGASSHVR